MPVIVQSRICGGATAQQKGEASQLRTYVDDWNLAHNDEVSLRKLLNRVVHSGDKVPYQMYLGHEEPNLFADDPVSGARYWGQKNLYDPRAETLITRAEDAKLRAPATQAKKTANSQLLVAGISAQANRVKDKGRAKREQEERIEREAFEASEAGRRLKEEAEEAEVKAKKDAEDKKKKNEDKKAQHKREVEERRVIREAEDKIKKAEEEAEAKKAKAVKVAPPQPAPAKKEKAPPVPPVVVVVPKKEEASKKKKEKTKAPASASASAVDDDSWMAEASAFNEKQKKEIQEETVTPYEEFTILQERGLDAVENHRLTDRVLAGVIMWDIEHPVRVSIMCVDYHTKQELITYGENWIDMMGKKQMISLIRVVGRVLCDLSFAKNTSGKPLSEAEKAHYFPQVLIGNFETSLKPNGWKDEELAKLPLDFSLIDGIIIPTVWFLFNDGTQLNERAMDGVEMYPYVTNAPPKQKKK